MTARVGASHKQGGVVVSGSFWLVLARSGSFWLVLARSGSFWLSFCRVLLFLHAACRPSPGRAAEIGLDMSGYVWICLDVSGCPDIRLSGCLDIHVDLSGFVWICVCEHLSLVCQHLPLTRDFCVNVQTQALAIPCVSGHVLKHSFRCASKVARSEGRILYMHMSKITLVVQHVSVMVCLSRAVQEV